LLRLEKFWAGWKNLKPGKITLDSIRDFSNHIHNEVMHAQPNARQRRKGYKAGSVSLVGVRSSASRRDLDRAY
jgi:hypothetical protein